jgi:hypothetical protein
LGYKQGVKGVILYDLNSKETFVSRNVVHHDNILPYTTSPTSPHWHYHLSFTSPDQPDHPDTTPLPTTSQSTNNHAPLPTSDDTSSQPTPDTSQTSPTQDISSSSSTQNSSSTAQIQNPSHTRPVRDKHVPSYLSDFVCNQASSSADHSSKGSLYPISEYHSLSQLSNTHHAYTMSVTHTPEPQSYKEACKFE